ncbi:MAG: BrnT family toxin [Oscillospiraceae bacterium]|jgi:uncharacterized DUF497 family protein|nr:BrnT family toxin [Oscillospiraceae bacterium]
MLSNKQDPTDVKQDVTYILNDVTFVWNNIKYNENIKKHDIRFEEAAEVLLHDDTLITPDIEHSDDEDRDIAIGFSFKLRVLVVCHCLRENGTIYRIISARKATKDEYEEFGEWLDEIKV